LQKAKETHEKYQGTLTTPEGLFLPALLKNEAVIFELFDKSGQRKYARSKSDVEASSFLSNKNSYILCFGFMPSAGSNC